MIMIRIPCISSRGTKRQTLNSQLTSGFLPPPPLPATASEGRPAPTSNLRADMLQTFSFNRTPWLCLFEVVLTCRLVLFNNARFYLTSSPGTPLGSHNNSYESLKDTSEMSFSTPSSSPRIPGREISSLHAVLPSLAPPDITSIAIQPPLRLLPFASSQASLIPKPDPTTPSLLDSSTSFARMMDHTGSPASFLTCSSGWDPGVVCGAVKFPSLLHSGQSVDCFYHTQETHGVPSDFKAGAQCSLLETKLSPASRSPSKVPFSVATPFYLSPSLRDGQFARPQPYDFITSTLPTLPRTALTPQLPSPTTSEYSAPSLQTNSPGSNFSLDESATSSIYHSPFHWDTVLAGFPPSPQRSPVLPTTVSEHLPARPSAPTAPVPSFVHCHGIATHPPQRDSTCSVAGPDIIPTIVVRGPDSEAVPTQASVSSIIGLYTGRRESVPLVPGETSIVELQPLEEAPTLHNSDEDDTDGEGGSSPESEFEIVTVPALKVRLDDILETDRVDVENAFGSLVVRWLSRSTPRLNLLHLDPGIHDIREF